MEVKWLGFAVGLENLRLKGTWFLAKAAERIWWCHLLTGKTWVKLTGGLSENAHERLNERRRWAGGRASSPCATSCGPQPESSG